jgi:hypothetical protein
LFFAAAFACQSATERGRAGHFIALSAVYKIPMLFLVVLYKLIFYIYIIVYFGGKRIDKPPKNCYNSTTNTVLECKLYHSENAFCLESTNPNEEREKT